MKFHRLKEIGSWIRESPKALAIISIGSLLSFILAFANGFYALRLYIENNQRIPTVIVSSVFSEKKYAPSNMGQILGVGPNYTIEGKLGKEKYPSLIFPYLHVQLNLLNPSSRPTTFMQCKLIATFQNFKDYEIKKKLTSDGYVDTADYLKSNRETGNNYFFLKPGEAIVANLMFFFIPLPDVTEVWEDENIALDISSTNVSCKNEFNETVRSF